MTLEEMIEANAKKGFIYVGQNCEGSLIWKEFDGIADVYYIDEGYPDIGCLVIWNTTRPKDTLRILLDDLNASK